MNNCSCNCNCNCNCNCGCNLSCKAIGILLSIVFGVLAGILFFFKALPCVTVSIWVALAIAVIVLIATIFAVFRSNSISDKVCLCRNISTLLVGVIGTIITAVVALALWLLPCSIFIATLIGLIAFFFVLTLSAVVCILLCLLDCND